MAILQLQMNILRIKMTEVTITDASYYFYYYYRYYNYCTTSTTYTTTFTTTITSTKIIVLSSY